MEKRNPSLNNSKNWWINPLIGGGIGFAVSLFLILLMPFILLRLNDPSAFILPTVAICLFTGGVLGGVVGAINTKGREIISGLINAGIFLAVMLLVSFVMKKGFDSIGFAILTGVVIISSLLGAYLVTKSNNSQKHNMRKIMKHR